MEWSIYIILLPAITGCLLLVIPEKWKLFKGIVTFIVTSVLFYCAFQIFKIQTDRFIFIPFKLKTLARFSVFRIDNLSKMIILFIGFLGTIVSFYSLKFIENRNIYKGYYTKFLLTLSASFGTVLTDNLITFTIFWGFLGLTLYRFLRGNDMRSAEAAKKSFIIIGASDSILIMGIGFLWLKAGSYFMSDMSIELNDGVAIAGFLSLLIASLAKAGAFPVHTWLPNYTESAPASVSAFLPAALDKLLGIYFLARICMDIFIITMWAKLLLLVIGSITIIIAVMMALVQHNYKKLLGYHAVSQVGYMVTGIGLGVPLGIAGGLFHMLNNVLYKSGLFLTSGAVEKQTCEEDLDNLGGLAVYMPLTFISALIFALSISGVPPFNGFVSKWIIYQGIIEFGKGNSLASHLWIVWLSAAVIGSALTLASFIKLISGIYLGRKKVKFKDVKEVSFIMWGPSLIIALLCIGFGIFGTYIVLPKLIQPVLGEFGYIGLWNSQLVGGLIVAGLILGIIIYLIGNIKNIKVKRQFVGGEIISEEMQYPSVEFYKTITEFKLLNWIYKKAIEKYFDIYDWGKKIVLWCSKILSYAHTGVLTLYTIWIIIGLIILFLILV